MAAIGRLGLTRRSVIAAASLAPVSELHAQGAAAMRFEDPATQGRAGYSESAMIAFIDPVQRLAASLRVCRYPPMGHAWLWCHVLTPSGFHSYVHHLASSGPNQAFPDKERADFSTSAHGAQANLVRSGSDGAVRGVDFAAAIDFREEADARLGPGERRGRLAGRFEPTHLHVGQRDTGRREQVGFVDAVFESGGHRYVLRGPGKYHEQAQTTPRFVDPFSYLAYWGPRGSGVAIKTVNGGSGAILADGATSFVTGFAAGPPGLRRRGEILRSDGPPLEAEFEALVRFSLPVFGRTWRGSFVRGTVAAQPVVGQFNDWEPERLSYRHRNAS